METPRRNRLDLCTPAELAIFNAMQEVEKAGADVRLTTATMLLSEAKDCVADFVDGVEPVEYLKQEIDKAKINKMSDNPCLSCNNWNPYGTGYCEAVQLCVGYNAYEPKKEQEKPSEQSAEEFLMTKYRDDKWEPNFDNIREAMEEYASQKHLPTDKEIEKETDRLIEHIYAGYASRALRSAMIDMARWFKEQIKK